MKRSFFLTIFLSLFFSFSISAQSYMLEGNVRDSVSGKTIENVVVEVVTSTGKTITSLSDVNGNFSAEVPAGACRLSARTLGYALRQTDINISSNSKVEILLPPQPVTLGEVQVSSLRVDRKEKELPIPLSVVESSRFRELSSLTLSNVLTSEPGVSSGGDGIWATNINVRGMNENRLVTLIDGNRVETANDLTASFSMIDINDVERVEIIKGAQSSLYGTGAMGGIVNIITKDGHFSAKPYLSGNLISGYASANNLLSGHADVNTGTRKWYLRLSGTRTKADDMRTPEGTLPNSQYTMNNVAARTGIKISRNQVLKLQYQRNWSDNVGIPGGSAFPGPAEATYTLISRQLFAASYEIKDITEKLSLLRVNYFNQYIKRDVSMIPNTVTITPTATGSIHTRPELVTPVGNHNTNGAQLETTWKFSNSNTLITGVDLWERRLTTSREKYIEVDILNTAGDTVKTNNIIRGETPIPTSTFSSAGIFMQDESRLMNNRLTIITGGRVDAIRVKNDVGYDVDYIVTNGVRNNTPANQRITFEKGETNSLSWSANAGILYKLFKAADVSLNIARSFRAPSLEERFKYIDLGNYVRLGDPDLKPENGYSADLGLRIWKNNLNLQVDGFVNRINNLVVETPGEFIYTINTGASEGTTDTIPALVNANVSKALLYGFDMGFEYSVTPRLVLFGSGAYVRGKDTESDADLPQIPPFNGRLGIRYIYPSVGSAELTCVGAADQDKIAEGEKRTGGYAHYDIALKSYPVSLGFTKLQFFAGVDNITDRSYTNHLTTNRGSISVEPGRNVYVRLSLSF
jgi:hemoglobin/transferrin/lactoferrin receptor protein